MVVKSRSSEDRFGPQQRALAARIETGFHFVAKRKNSQPAQTRIGSTASGPSRPCLKNSCRQCRRSGQAQTDANDPLETYCPETYPGPHPTSIQAAPRLELFQSVRHVSWKEKALCPAATYQMCPEFGWQRPWQAYISAASR
jgi:hypothetical protein